MQLMKQTRDTFGHTDVWKKSETVLQIILLFTSYFSVSVAVFTRRDFGERYLGWLNLYFGYSVVAGFMFFGNLLSVITRHGSSRLMGAFWLAFIGMSFYHRLAIHRRNNARIDWHSNYLGTSLLQLPVSAEVIYKFIEPGAVFVVGYILYQVSGLVGLWLIIGAVSLFINNQIVFHMERQAILDMRDARIEANYMSDALAGKPASETAGFVIAESSIRLIGTDMRLSDAFNRLSDEMKSLLDAPPQTHGGSIA